MLYMVVYLCVFKHDLYIIREIVTVKTMRTGLRDNVCYFTV